MYGGVVVGLFLHRLLRRGNKKRGNYIKVEPLMIWTTVTDVPYKPNKCDV